MRKNIRLKIGVIMVIISIILQSCMTGNPQKYNNSKLSRVIENQIRAVIEQETLEEIETMLKENKSLTQKVNDLQIQFDSLKTTIKQTDTVFVNDYCFVFFNTSSIKVKSESLSAMNAWMVQKEMNGNKQFRYSIIGYSDMSGDSLSNIQLAYKRAVYMKEVLINNYCIEDSLITISSQANIKSCKNDLYRSVKIQSFN